MIKKIAQKHGLGCGVACVASALNVNYDEALMLFEKPENAGTLGYLCKDLVLALAMAGKSYKHKYLKNKADAVLSVPGTIVFTRFSKAYPRGHYLIKTQKGWMNPWVNFPDTPVQAEIVKELPAEPIYAIFSTEM